MRSSECRGHDRSVARLGSQRGNQLQHRILAADVGKHVVSGAVTDLVAISAHDDDAVRSANEVGEVRRHVVDATEQILG
jgi:hypothetical protein